MAQTTLFPEEQYEHDLVEDIKATETDGNFASTKLRTDERVIARVTDGIYRQPASALRELISNSYDADAKKVIIKTDAPRFDRISIEDDGVGMSPEALAHMLLHIGGSAKRQERGQELGITDITNSLFSPSGKRRLIGKIGIGIFSVAQLTHTFQIITKTKGDKFRTVATVALKQYSDEGKKDEETGKEEFESGSVNIWREKASDFESHGTTVILTNIRPQARDTLQSKETWALIEHNEEAIARGDLGQNIEPPKYHIGRVDRDNKDILKSSNGTTINVPWKEEDNQKVAFQRLVQSVWDETYIGNANPRLEKLFDYYLQMVWNISLSIPIDYVDGHLFDMDLTSWADAFQISNEMKKGSAHQLSILPGTRIRDVLNLTEGSDTDFFNVFIDNLELHRPIKFKDLPIVSNNQLKKQLVFFGKCREEFKNHPKELSTGTLDFEAYLFWTPKVVPTEHRGSLIRINGASGTLFDSSFMRYQVSEQNRLRQITCEIFVHEGFDSALNIDRESFNYAHPHSVFLTKWLHSALRQLATAQKKVAAEIRGVNRQVATSQNVSNIQKLVSDVWEQETNDRDSDPPSVSIEEIGQQPHLIPGSDIVLNRSSIISASKGKQTEKSKAQSTLLDEKLKAITQILASFRVLDNLSKSQTERLLKAIYEVLEMSE